MLENKNLEQKFQVIADQHKGIFFKVARTYCQNEEDRQDLIQEILVQVWKALPSYNSHYTLSTWLYRISLNVAISFYRKNVKGQDHLQPLNEAIGCKSDEVNNDKEDQFVMLDQFISELNQLDKALILMYLEDKSHAEIADILGMSISNVGTKLLRIKEKLKNKFSKFK